MKEGRATKVLKSCRGAMTLFTLLMTMTLVLVFSALALFAAVQTRHAETLRNLEMTGQSLLHTYDRQLLESYSLLGVDLEVADPGAYLSGEVGFGSGGRETDRRWNFVPLQTLDHPEYFLDAVQNAVALGAPGELLEWFAQNLRQAPEQAGENAFDSEAASFEKAFEERTGSDSDSGKESFEGSEEEKALALTAVQWIRRVKAHASPESLDENGDEDLILETSKLYSHAFAGSIKTLTVVERLPFVYYVSRHFRHRVMDGRAPFFTSVMPASFFSAEQEYILYGHDSEAANEFRAYIDVYLMRLAGNFAHVMTCQVKQEQIGAVSGAVNAVFGIPSGATAAALALTWAAAESRSDLSRLLSGEVLPWIHYDDSNWRTGFGEGSASGGMDAGGDSGTERKPEMQPTVREKLSMADYGDHLTALLYGKANTRHVLRAMDLVAVGCGREEETLDLSRRAIRFSIRVDPAGTLPGVVWEDGYGLE